MMKKTIYVICLLLVFAILSGCTQSRLSQNQSGIPDETTVSPTVRVTFPEGFTAVQIAERLEENGVCTAEDFIRAVRSPGEAAENYPFIAEINNPTQRPFLLEGYLFPDTYEFYRGESAESVLGRFLKNTALKLTDEYAVRADQLGYSLDQILALASVIQKEAGMKEQMGKVSSVLHNRLESESYGKLQCDVTINYINDYVTSSPYLPQSTTDFAALYNTYKCQGLPAGAICNPGLDAINAALYPEKTDWFFFVTDKDKNYYYASTYEEHLKNCRLCGIEG